MSEDEIFLTHILQCSRAELLLKKPALTSSQEKRLKEYKDRRSHGEPLQYIIGSWDFCGLTFKVNQNVLIPRPETEMLVDLAIKKFKGTHLLELGTGSGNIAVTLAKFLPLAKIVSVDISMDALMLANENAQRNGVEGHIEFIQEDMAKYLRDKVDFPSKEEHNDARCFDMIVSNPPYIPREDLNKLPADVKHEPALALDGGEDGLDFFRTIIKYAPRLLRDGGCLMMEFGDGQAPRIKSIGATQGFFKNIEIVKDLTGKERIIICY